MLVMITNRCHEGCRHCMSDCKPEGTDMDLMTFGKAIKFARFLGARFLVLSGGEPTLNPDWFRMCQILNDQYHMPFGICTNGTWVEDQKTFRRMARVNEMRYCTGIQVYTNQMFYKSYNLVKSHEQDLLKIGLHIDESPIRSMKDLGRAKTDPACQAVIDRDKYFMSCLNTALAAKQVPVSGNFCKVLENEAGHFCKPCVDPTGKLHMSESQLCPVVGDITKEFFADIWDKMRQWQPCGGCKDYYKFRDSERPELIPARALLGITKPEPDGEIQQTLAQFLGDCPSLSQEAQEKLQKFTENQEQ